MGSKSSSCLHISVLPIYYIYIINFNINYIDAPPQAKLLPLCVEGQPPHPLQTALVLRQTQTPVLLLHRSPRNLPLIRRHPLPPQRILNK